MRTADRLLAIYRTLAEAFGPQHWWPGETPLEIAVGAVLTQNTNWANVEKAIGNLKAHDLLDLEKLATLPPEILAHYIRPAGYYNLKAKRLQNLLRLIHVQSGDLDAFLARPAEQLRQTLLAVKGIGPETADSIILYAANQPIFVVDAYTHRLLLRHNLISEEADYHEIQELFMDNLPPDPALYNEYHALIVRCGKQFCKKSKPDCRACPLPDPAARAELFS